MSAAAAAAAATADAAASRWDLCSIPKISDNIPAGISGARSRESVNGSAMTRNVFGGASPLLVLFLTLSCARLISPE